MNVKIAFGFGKFYVSVITYLNFVLWSVRLKIKLWNFFLCFCTSYHIINSSISFCCVLLLFFFVCFCFYIEAILHVKRFFLLLSFFFITRQSKNFKTIFIFILNTNVLFYIRWYYVLYACVFVCVIMVKMLSSVF